MLTFEEVYARYRQPVWRLARRMTGTEAEALDACQEIFLRVWRGLAGFRGDSKLSTWVFQIAWNYLRWYRRRTGRGPLMVSTTPDDERPVAEPADDRPDPERRATASDRLARVVAAVDDLPEHYRVVVWLRDAEDLSYDEIAAALDVPIGTVRSRLARARKLLREAVDPDD